MRDGERNQDTRQRTAAQHHRRAGYASPLRPLGRIATSGAAIWLRTRAVRLVLGTREWRRNAFVRDACVSGRRQIRDDARRPSRLVRKAEKTCEGPRAASRAAILYRRAGGPVRLLLQRNDHPGRRASLENAAADRIADPRRDERPSLPLRQLPAGYQSHPTGIARND